MRTNIQNVFLTIELSAVILFSIAVIGEIMKQNRRWSDKRDFGPLVAFVFNFGLWALIIVAVWGLL